jgi:hypothetical protein
VPAYNNQKTVNPVPDADFEVDYFDESNEQLLLLE